MMKYLKEHYSEVQLNVLVLHRNREVIDLLEITGIENILTIRADSGASFLRDSAKVIQRLRTMKFDAVIDCELFARVSSLFSFFSGAPIKVGFHRYNQEGLYRGNFINRPVLYNPYLHISKQFLNLAYTLEENTFPNVKQLAPTELPHAPQIQFPVAEIKRFTEKLSRDFPKIGDRRLVLVYPSGGLLPIRAWPLDNFCQLSRALINEGLLVGIIGPDTDSTLGEQIVHFTGNENCFDLTGYTQTIQELLILYQQADLLIANDGGPCQFAALVDIPIIAFFGPESPQLYAPLSSKAYYFYRQLGCSPCLTAYNNRYSPCDGDNQCLKLITVKNALDKALELLTLRSPVSTTQ